MSLLVLSMTLASACAPQDPWSGVVADALRGVVCVRSRIRYSVGRDEVGPFEGTGFVVDAARGIIATNRHVAGEGVVVDLEVRFFDGSAVPAQRVWADPLHDFAFLQFDTKTAPKDISVISLQHREPAIGGEVRMIGNNGGLAATVLPGNVSNLNAWWDQDPSVAYIQTSIASVGGSSGSPVLDPSGAAIGLQTAHDEHNSYALPAEYLADALARLQKNDIPKRGSLGLRLRQVEFTEAVAVGAITDDIAKHLAPPPQSAPELQQPPVLSLVEGVVPDTPASGVLMPGDALISIADVMADDARGVEKALDQHVAEDVVVRFYRGGVLESRTLRVADLCTDGVDRLAVFCGAAFHDVSYEMRSRADLARRGALISYVAQGSAAEAADLQRDDLILAAGGKPVADTSALWAIFSAERDGARLALLVRRPSSFDSATRLLLLTVDRTWDQSRFLVRTGGKWIDAAESAASAPSSRPVGPAAQAQPREATDLRSKQR